MNTPISTPSLDAAPSELAYDISQCVHRDDITPEQITIWGDIPITLRPLRRLEDGTLRSGIVTLQEGWSSQNAWTVSVTQQFLVLSGSIRLGDQELGANAFVVVPAGQTMPMITACQDTDLIVIQDAGQSFAPAACEATQTSQIVVIADVYAIEPFTPVINGEPLHGFSRRVLWIDEKTGADTRWLCVPAGFRGGGPNWHPVQEEIFCIEGDIQPDATRPMRSGSFLWNPARSVHGFDEVTHGGCVLLEWHDGAWDLIKA